MQDADQTGPTAGKPLRALIVEDRENDAVLLVRSLRGAGYALTFERVQTAAARATVNATVLKLEEIGPHLIELGLK